MKAWQVGLMPCYHFHLHDEHDVPDNEGQQFPTIKAAQKYAIGLARFEAGQSIREKGQLDLGHRIDIENNCGVVVAKVPFKDAIKIKH